MALAKSNKMDLEYSQRWRDLMTQMDNLTEQEKQAAAERITLAQERNHLETLRKSLMCISCRNSLSGGTGTMNSKVPKMTATFTSANLGSAFWGGYQPETTPVQATEDSSPVVQDTLNAIRTDQWLKQLKKQSLKVGCSFCKTSRPVTIYDYYLINWKWTIVCDTSYCNNIFNVGNTRS